ncbi:MAG TPA: hypothetical protein VLL57_07805 [Candidatus Binataceae bacterium]|nr:hypothetical protein [Candidatus Binataceae bacterium]
MVVSIGRDLSAQVRAPRTVFVNFPMGNPFGRPFDVKTQRAILLDALRALTSVHEGGVLIDLPHQWGENFGMNLGSGYGKREARSPS